MLHRETLSQIKEQNKVFGQGARSKLSLTHWQSDCGNWTDEDRDPPSSPSFTQWLQSWGSVPSYFQRGDNDVLRTVLLELSLLKSHFPPRPASA